MRLISTALMFVGAFFLSAALVGDWLRHVAEGFTGSLYPGLLGTGLLAGSMAAGVTHKWLVDRKFKRTMAALAAGQPPKSESRA